MQKRKQKVLIAGTGIGGLATALRLVKRGYEVEMVEKNGTAGGRLNQLRKDGFTFDTGPSFFSMSYVFKSFAEDCNIEMPFRFMELDPLYAVNFRGCKKTYFLYKDIERLAEQFRDAEPGFAEKMEKYLRKSGNLFHDTFDLIIRNNFDSVIEYFLTLIRVNPVHLPVLFRSFYKQVKLYFSSREARQIISLVAFFLGRTPFDTMGIYTLLSYTEFRHDGYYNVEGGMYSIVEGILRELNKEGVKISYNTEIVDYISSKPLLSGLTDDKGKVWDADIFIINGDAAAFRGQVFKRKKYSESKLDRKRWTMGYLSFYLGLKCKLPGVHHHNYFLGTNFDEYAHKVMKDTGVLQKPYYYVNVLSKHNAGCAPPGCESLFFVCPVPTLFHKPDWSDRDQIVDSIIADFSERIGKDISSEIISRTVYTPIDWQQQLNLHRGSGLGLAHSFNQIGAFRPPNRDEQFRNTFYVGASTIPGAGLPMGIISSELVTKRVLKYSSSL